MMPCGGRDQARRAPRHPTGDALAVALVVQPVAPQRETVAGQQVSGVAVAERPHLALRDQCTHVDGVGAAGDHGTRPRVAFDPRVFACLAAQAETPAAHAQQHLFVPLGIGRSEWELDEQGRQLGFRGLKLRTLDMARLGQLWLDAGAWAGQAVLPRDYALATTTRHHGGGPPVGQPCG
jgi:CubicO group peptidase (beta-lactamase class C family)